MNSSPLPWRVLSPIVTKGFSTKRQIRICQLSNCLVDFRADYLTLERVIGDFRKNRILQTDFEGKKTLARIIPGKNNILH